MDLASCERNIKPTVVSSAQKSCVGCGLWISPRLRSSENLLNFPCMEVVFAPLYLDVGFLTELEALLYFLVSSDQADITLLRGR